MDTSASDITFDAHGQCSFCTEFFDLMRADKRTPAQKQAELQSIVQEMKDAGKGRKYDCVLGVSGGVDSTYAAHVLKQLGLRTLAVHMDNGWNSELAVRNIEKVLHGLGIDLETTVLNWEEFRDLQVAFLKAGVSDAEIPTDHAIQGVVYRAAAKHGVRYIASGCNYASEAILPSSWTYGVMDWHYIRSIHQRFGTVPLKTYPHLSHTVWLYHTFIRRTKNIHILNYVPYIKQEAMRVLQEELGWQYYGGKHYESIYTRFFQGYILPRKFDIDKRKAHLSTLICSGQITREEALQELSRDPYPEEMQQEDRTYTLKKLGLTEAQFQEIMSGPIHTWRDYPNSRARVEKLLPIVRTLRRWHLLPSNRW